MSCPVHGTSEDSWPCPDDCPDFLGELERRIEDVAVNGNYVRTSVVEGVMYKQTFRNHQPLGEPVEVTRMYQGPPFGGDEHKELAKRYRKTGGRAPSANERAADHAALKPWDKEEQ